MARSTIVLPETQGSSLEEFWMEQGPPPAPPGERAVDRGHRSRPAACRRVEVDSIERFF